MQDRFGIDMLNPTLAGGREWLSSWDNGTPRTLHPGQEDVEDSEFKLRGKNGSLKIDGNGVAEIIDGSPRMYIYDPCKPKWKNAEVTFYGMRIKEIGTRSSQGFTAGVRSEHQAFQCDPFLARTYYGRLLYDGRINFQKELYHDQDDTKIITSNQPSEKSSFDWSKLGGSKDYLPCNVWIGYKFIIQNIENNTKVKLRLLIDQTAGQEGGHWESPIEYIDEGFWPITNPSDSQPNSPILLDPGTSIFVRNDAISSAKYMKFSIREIISDE
jgi:hypothetical protein